MTSETLRFICDHSSVTSSSEENAANNSKIINDDLTEQVRERISEDGLPDSDLDQVRKVAERLKLNPRRPSIVKWMTENQNGGFKKRTAVSRPPLPEDQNVQTVGLNQRFSNVGDAIQWIKNELIQLQTLDHQLARQLIGLRAEINRFKLHKSCTEHQALLDDVTLELEEQDEISDLCDIIPFQEYTCTSSLRGIGITRMNLCARRFSLS